MFLSKRTQRRLLLFMLRYVRLQPRSFALKRGASWKEAKNSNQQIAGIRFVRYKISLLPCTICIFRSAEGRFTAAATISHIFLAIPTTFLFSSRGKEFVTIFNAYKQTNKQNPSLLPHSWQACPKEKRKSSGTDFRGEKTQQKDWDLNHSPFL